MIQKNWQELIKPTNLEVVSGDGSNLEISPVYDHINAVKPKGKDKKPKDIVIPKGTNKKNQ